MNEAGLPIAEQIQTMTAKLLATQPAANLRAAGGATMIWNQVLNRLLDRFISREESP